MIGLALGLIVAVTQAPVFNRQLFAAMKPTSTPAELVGQQGAMWKLALAMGGGEAISAGHQLLGVFPLPASENDAAIYLFAVCAVLAFLSGRPLAEYARWAGDTASAIRKAGGSSG